MPSNAGIDLRLRTVASHPSTSPGSRRSSGTCFALSSHRSSLLLARGALLIEQSSATLAVRASLRAPAFVERLVYCGGSRVYVAFLDDLTAAAYKERRSEAGVDLVAVHSLGGESGRACEIADGSRYRSFAVFAKAGSSNIHCVVSSPDVKGGTKVVLNIFKLLAGMQGALDNISGIDKSLNKLKGKVASKAGSKMSVVVAVAAHPTKDFAAAAYDNGLVRVWNITRKELWGVYDGQMLMREGVVTIAFHPEFDVLVAATNQGRVISFLIRGIPIGRADEPFFAAHKVRDRGRRYRAMNFLQGTPSALLLLTASRRIVVRLVNDRGMMHASSMYPKASRPLAVEGEDGSGGSGEVPEGMLSASEAVCMSSESTYGLIAVSFNESSGNVFLYERFLDGVSGVRRAVVGAPIDTPFSEVTGKAFNGPVTLPEDGVFAQSGFLYSYTLRDKQLVRLCRLPPSSEVRRLEVARDQYGVVLAVLVFLLTDVEAEGDESGFNFNTGTHQFVMVTKRGDGESWNVSEALDGASGCFLSGTGQHDRMLILSPDGKIVSVRSFAGQRLSSAQQQDPSISRANSRGKQSFKVSDAGVSKVFRSPFSAWCAVVYEDAPRRRIAISNNAFGRTPDIGEGDGNPDNALFALDEASTMSLHVGERVLDVRWQKLISAARSNEQYLGAVMTNSRVYIVRDLFEPVAKFDFASINRLVMPFTIPTMCWVGPAVMILFGQFLYAVTLDGEADLIAGLSQGDNACALAAVLPDSVVYVRPPMSKNLPVDVVSRPIGLMSIVVRGMLALPSARKHKGSSYIGKLKDILTSHDASQGSEALIQALIRNELAPIAYILVVSRIGQHNLPALKRAAFLGIIGDLRGALAVAEAEYSRLPTADAFHGGTEIFRTLQRILNMAMACGEFAVGERCSELLGRRGTFSAFIDQEGGYAAVTSLAKNAKKSGNVGIASALAPLMERSSKSCIATDESRIPSPTQLMHTRAGIESYDRSAVQLGSEESPVIMTIAPPVEGADGKFGASQPSELPKLSCARFLDRLEMLRRDDVIILKNVMNDDGGLRGGAATGYDTYGDIGGFDCTVDPTVPRAVPLIGPGWAAASFDGPLVPQQRPEMREAAEIHSANLQNDSKTLGGRVTSTGQEARLDKKTSSDNIRGNMSAAVDDRAALLRHAAGKRPDQEATRAFQGALEMMATGRYSSALREIKRALKLLGRAKARDGFNVQQTQVTILVHYGVALELLCALERLSEGVSSQDGGQKRLLYASALASVPLQPVHRVSALLMSTSANMDVGNFGFAMSALKEIREIGVVPLVGAELKAKFNACAARGGGNQVPILTKRFCFYTLKPITTDVQEICCNFCPAFFSVDALRKESLMEREATCLCCHIGGLTPR